MERSHPTCQWGVFYEPPTLIHPVVTVNCNHAKNTTSNTPFYSGYLPLENPTSFETNSPLELEVPSNPVFAPSMGPLPQLTAADNEFFIEFLAEATESLPPLQPQGDISSVGLPPLDGYLSHFELPTKQPNTQDINCVGLGGVDFCIDPPVQFASTQAEFTLPLLPCLQPPMLLSQPTHATFFRVNMPSANMATFPAAQALPVNLRVCMWEDCFVTGKEETHWRKGPLGEATLCNKHGLRYAHSLRREAVNARRRNVYAARSMQMEVARQGGRSQKTLRKRQ